ncbi:nucleoside hydrolase [Metabacillus idriensis]|uniref:nucleoside hydrolase n=1 Tax=Metabacillus idriensis TaxID=324768 RepID=UPI00174A1080|nr:nucleoside hydrolase [Metabacillus idriensis]
MAAKKVLFFGDFGVDDIVALMYSYYDDEIEVIGIVADYGNVSKQTAINSARYFTMLTKTSNIPIIGGAARPLTGENPVSYPEVHGEQGLGPIVPEIEASQGDFENFELIRSLIIQYNYDVTIVNVGRLTSLATAFVLFPTVLGKVKRIFVMGGAFLYPGNVSPVAEANFYGDPAAANLVMTIAKRVTIFPLNVTNYAIIPDEVISDLDQFYQENNDKVGKLLKQMIDFYTNFYKKNTPEIAGGPLHDLLTLWAAVRENQITFVEKPVKIILESEFPRGQSIADFRPYKTLADYPIHRIAVKFNYDAFLADFIKVMKGG